MRYVMALLLAASLVFGAFWIGSWISTLVGGPHRDFNEFTVGRRMDLCGYAVDMRHAGGGYDLKQWTGVRCDALSELDRCMLECLSAAGTIEIGAACFSDCVDD